MPRAKAIKAKRTAKVKRAQKRQARKGEFNCGWSAWAWVGTVRKGEWVSFLTKCEVQCNPRKPPRKGKRPFEVVLVECGPKKKDIDCPGQCECDSVLVNGNWEWSCNACADGCICPGPPAERPGPFTPPVFYNCQAPPPGKGKGKG
jgi:hypothetical protein